MSHSQTPIVVLGTFRSGTSAMAGAVQRLGVYLGEDDDFFPANEFNEGGYYELKELQAIIQRTFMTFGAMSTQFDYLPEDWKEIPNIMNHVQEIRNLLKAKYGGRDQWGWKDPATSLLLPLFQEALAQDGIKPRYVIMVRNPLDVAASRVRGQSKWEFNTVNSGGKKSAIPVAERTMGLWLTYTLAALRETKGSVRQLVSYEKLLAEPRAVIESIAKNVVPWEVTEEQITDAAGTIDPKQSHGKDQTEELKTWPELVTKAYQSLLKMVDDPEGLNAGNYDGEIDALWEDLQRMRKMMQTVQMPGGQVIMMWRGAKAAPVALDPKGYPAGPNVFAQGFSPTGSWQKMRMTVPVPPGSNVSLDLYQTPCHVWIRQANWIVDGKERKATLAPGPGGMLEDVMGMKRVTIFGPQPVYLQAPASAECEIEFEIDFLVQASQLFATNVVSILRSKLEQVRRMPAPSPYMARR